jgi:hypothetical protein
MLSVSSRSPQSKLTDTICIEHSQRTLSQQSGAIPFDLYIVRKLKDNLTVNFLQSPTTCRLKGSRFLPHSILERFQTVRQTQAITFGGPLSRNACWCFARPVLCSLQYNFITHPFGANRSCGITLSGQTGLFLLPLTWHCVFVPPINYVGKYLALC